MKKYYIRFVVGGITHVSYPEIEQRVKRDLFKLYGPEETVECREFKSGYLYEEIKLKDLFNYDMKKFKLLPEIGPDYFIVKRQPSSIFHHGTWYNSCEICDEEIGEDNPGKEIHHDEKGVHHVTIVCNSCFIDPECIALFVSKENLKINKFEV